MHRYYLFLSLFGISICCLDSIVAREAIVGGLKTGHLPFLYQVTILIHGQAPRCGGGIIGKLFVLTAAHCFITENSTLIGHPIHVLVGTKALSVPGTVVEVGRVFIPMVYQPWNPYSVGDVAVLELKQPLTIDKNNLKLVNLPKYKESSRYDNKTARIAGFGWDMIFKNNELIGDNSDDELRFIDATVRSETECKHDHPGAELSEQHLCARVLQGHGAFARGVCIGDAGGPLVLRGRTVIGILSVTTVGCWEKASSGIYTRVSHYRDFIVDVMENVKSANTRVIQL